MLRYLNQSVTPDNRAQLIFLGSIDNLKVKNDNFTMSDSPLNFTDSAAAKVKTLIDEENNPKLNLRVFVSGGGCSGFQYGFTFDDTINDGDIVIKKTVVTEEKDEDDGGDSGSTVNLLVDPISFQYLQGADIDYREDLNGSQFIIRNPNAKTTCGCGSSFST